MLRSVLIGALAMIATPAAAVVIDFNEQPPGLVAGPLVYPEATFTAGGGGTLFIFGDTNFICALSAGCVDPITVDFLGDPFYADGLTFTVGGENVAGDVGDIAVFGIGGAFSGIMDILADGDTDIRDLQDLSAFGAISRIVITTTDILGLTYDDFTFDILVIDAPEPATIALFGLGLVALGYRRFGTHRHRLERP